MPRAVLLLVLGVLAALASPTVCLAQEAADRTPLPWVKAADDVTRASAEGPEALKREGRVRAREGGPAPTRKRVGG
jgi:uncharacterized membrane protein